MYNCISFTFRSLPIPTLRLACKWRRCAIQFKKHMRGACVTVYNESGSDSTWNHWIIESCWEFYFISKMTERALIRTPWRLNRANPSKWLPLSHSLHHSVAIDGRVFDREMEEWKSCIFNCTRIGVKTGLLHRPVGSLQEMEDEVAAAVDT